MMFKIGDKVRIIKSKNGSTDVVNHAGEIVTIEKIDYECKLIYLREYPTVTVGDMTIPHAWRFGCFTSIN